LKRLNAATQLLIKPGKLLGLIFPAELSAELNQQYMGAIEA